MGLRYHRKGNDMIVNGKKRCSHCKDEKPVSEFHSNCTNKDELDCYCIKCSNEDDSKYHKTDHYRSKNNKRLRDNRINRPEISHAWDAVTNAIKRGKLVRLPCETCKTQDGIINFKSQAHHDDYSKKLDVRWLCSKHHPKNINYKNTLSQISLFQ